MGAPPSHSGGAQVKSCKKEKSDIVHYTNFQLAYYVTITIPAKSGPQSMHVGWPHGSGSSQGSLARMSGPVISAGSDGPILLAALTRNL